MELVYIIIGGFFLFVIIAGAVKMAVKEALPSAMKNKDTWSEGNRFCGLILICSGAIFITFSILVRYLYNNNLNFSMRVSVAALAMILMGNIIFTEIHLRKLFDKNGIRKR